MSLCFSLLTVECLACQVDRYTVQGLKKKGNINIIWGLCLGLHSFPIYFILLNKVNIVILHSPASSVEGLGLPYG